MCVVVICLPPGWTTMMGSWRMGVDDGGVHPVSSMQEAAVSISAVLCRSGGLVQPEEVPLT